MKKVTLTFFGLLLSIFAIAQTPQGMSYQAVIRDASGTLVTNQSIGFKISILQGSDSGTIVYQETHLPTTNTNGLISLVIGNGSIISGDFEAIDWANGPYFIKTETDINGSSNYTITGVSQLMSVPYALHANTAENIKTYNIGDFAQGGVVFWVDETKQHGLVCAIFDISGTMQWYAGAYSDTIAMGDGPMSGEMNTAIIVAKLGKGDGNPYAARLCSELFTTENNISYGDWYLPSKYELQLIYQNKEAIDTAITNYGGLVLSTGYYWSSTEIDNEHTWSLSMGTGNLNQSYKFYGNRVRAIRAF